MTEKLTGMSSLNNPVKKSQSSPEAERAAVRQLVQAARERGEDLTAKGVALIMVGFLFVLAAARNAPSKPTGLDGALRTLRQAPAGSWLLSLVAIGIAAYGVYSIARARYARV